MIIPVKYIILLIELFSECKVTINKIKNKLSYAPTITINKFILYCLRFALSLHIDINNSYITYGK